MRAMPINVSLNVTEPISEPTKTSSAEQRVCVPAKRILRRNGGRAARIESLGFLVRAYIQEYPNAEHMHCIEMPVNVMSKIR